MAVAWVAVATIKRTGHAFMEVGDVCSRHRSPELVRARELVMVLGVERYSLKVQDFAATLRKHPDRMFRALARGTRRRVDDD